MKIILVIDNHPAFRAGVKVIVEKGKDYTVAGEVGTAEQGFRLAQELEPDIVILELQLPGGIDLVKKLADNLKNTRIIVITWNFKKVFMLKAVQAGAAGYVTKESEPECILECLDAVLSGKMFIDSSLDPGNSEKSGLLDKYTSLTNREQDVMHLIIDNHTTKKIAEKLGISPNTVRTHRTSLYKKTWVSSNIELVKFAAKIGLLDTRL
ncbi:MAG: response regulator transcription factor [Desulfobacterales bacterium]|nr:response regulator transcription factor [Desulfobacterales bacterium]